MQRRDEIINLVKKILHGPLLGKEEVLKEHPLKLYSTGILFPKDIGVDNEEERELLYNQKKEKSLPEQILNEESFAEPTTTEDDESSISLNRKAFYHSSFGVSFCTTLDAKIRIVARYQLYTFRLLGKTQEEEPIEEYTLSPEIINTLEISNQKEIPINEDGKLKLIIKRTNQEKKTNYTIFFFNDYLAGKDENKKVNHKFNQSILHTIIFRPKLEIQVIGDNHKFIPIDTGYKTIQIESNIEKMLYREHITFSKGHNTASLDCMENGNCIKVETVFIPEMTLPVLSTDIKNASIQDIEILKIKTILEKPKKDVMNLLEKFANLYKDWIDKLEIPKGFQESAKENQSICNHTYQRILEGISILKKDDGIFQIWKDSNYVVNEQFHYSQPEQEFIWRPFQLGFFLLSISGIVNPKHKDRNFADLLWVTTGGGKTEAYLAIMAFTVFHRRWKYKKNGIGLSVISRYTLRLLTAQQFERTAALVCAMELLRKDKEGIYGAEPILLGLFVGAESTPNKIDDLKSKLKEIKLGEKLNPFPIKRCPKCKQNLYNSNKELEYTEDNSGNSFCFVAETKRGSANSFIILCLNPKCSFHKKPIPVDFVDESLEKKRPCILISTIDKLAMSPFKANDYKKILMVKNAMPVDLIVQDELHLINSALGSIFGAYETGIHTILENKSDYPEAIENYKIKIIASTATPKNAETQLDLLFNRDYSVFPASGTSIDDSFFTHFVPTENGRKYVGFFSTGTSPKTFAGDVAAAILVASSIYDAEITNQNKEQIRFVWNGDSNYYKLLTFYFNAIRVLSGFSAMILSDIPKRMSFLFSMIIKGVKEGKIKELEPILSNIPEVESILRSMETVELTGRAKGETLSEHLKRVSEKNPPDILLSTNMISVGIDIDRLNQMVVMGQPKLTSEYIQASSRTGRKYETAPGIVYMVYNSSKPRDISHYEYFCSYHNSIYKYVEPVTVTPFSSRVMERTLHSVIISIARFLLDEEGAVSIPKKILDIFKTLDQLTKIQNEDLKIFAKLYRSIEDRLERLVQKEKISKDDKKYFLEVFVRYIESFKEYVSKKKETLQLNYAYIPGAKIKENIDYLIQFAGNTELKKKINYAGTVKESMTSMRNVSQDCPIRLRDSIYNKEEK